MSLSPTVSVIVVSHNTRDMTLECLRSVYQQTSQTRFELIVVDNASVDGSVAAIQQEFGDRLKLISSADNLGFARANNAASHYATGEYLLLLNPDTLVLNGAIDRLVEFARERPEAGIWGGRTLTGSRRLDPRCCWARMTPLSVACIALGLAGIFPRSAIFNREGLGGWDRDTDRPVDIVTGCFFLITARLWRQLGGFNPIFFMYGEEADLCLRARDAGHQPWFTARAEIVHYGGASERVRSDKLVRLLKAKAHLQALHWPPLWQRFGRLMHRVWVIRSYLQNRWRPTGHEAALAWRTVWNRRAEWLTVEGGRTDAAIEAIARAGRPTD